MDAKIKSIEKNDTLELINLSRSQKTISVKWGYKTKLNKKGEVGKHKAYLVEKRYKHKYGVDCKKVFALVARQNTIYLIISLTTQNSQPIQLDVKFLLLYTMNCKNTCLQTNLQDDYV